jgi:hypothetical protein
MNRNISFPTCEGAPLLISMIMIVIGLLPRLLLAQPYQDSPADKSIESDMEWGDSYNKNSDPDLTDSEAEQEDPSDEGHSLVHIVLLYLPNRLFDVLDMVRARIKAGPGFGAGLRFTDVGELYLGAHTSIFAGAPGPRQEPGIPIPAGIESRGGIKLSLLDGTVGMGFDPHYSSTEIGTSLHLGLLGADLMIDPVEFVDLIAGIFLFDVRDDDL